MPNTANTVLSTSSLSAASPLQNYWQGEQAANRSCELLQLREVPNLSLLMIQGLLESNDNPLKSGTFVLNNEPNKVFGHDPACLWLAPRQWLLVSTANEADAIAELKDAIPEGFIISPVSGSRCAIDVSGEVAQRFLNKGCGLNLDPKIFKVGCCAQTVFAQLDILIYPLAEQGRRQSSPTYRLLVSRGDADYLWRWLLASAREVR